MQIIWKLSFFSSRYHWYGIGQILPHLTGFKKFKMRKYEMGETMCLLKREIVALRRLVDDNSVTAPVGGWWWLHRRFPIRRQDGWFSPGEWPVSYKLQPRGEKNFNFADKIWKPGFGWWGSIIIKCRLNIFISRRNLMYEWTLNW